MDFFERQDQARRHTKLLVVYFFLAIALTILAIYVVFALVFLRQREIDNVFLRLWDPQLFFGVSAGTLFVILLGSLTKTFELRQGGGAVAAMLGGRPLDGNTQQPDERKLLNVVEEMAIASGTPVPEVYLLPEEKSINAFAAGHSPQNAAIGVTDGCMRLLNRDELQGVIGHEFSHILNGDMRLNLQLMGIVNGLVFVTIIGRQILWATAGMRSRAYRLCASNRGKGGNPLPLLGLALMVIGAIGVFFGRLIKSAVSRQREYLADASSVQFTRNPDGLSGALKKIGGLSTGSRLQTARAEQASHMFFGNGLAESWFQLMSTHPPLGDRIRAIDPSFDGRYPEVSSPVEASAPAPATASERYRTRHRPPVVRVPVLGDLLGGHMPAAGLAGAAIGAQDLINRVGAVSTQHLDFAAKFKAELHPELENAAHEPSEAAALIYALLLSPDAGVRANQLQQLERWSQPGIRQTVLRLQPNVELLEARSRLPLVMLCLPTLRRLSAAQFENFSRVMKLLIESDQQVDLFEYTLQKIVLRHLEPHFKPGRKPVVQYYSLAPLVADCAVLLSALARIGNSATADMENALHTGAKHLDRPEGELQLLDISKCGLGQVNTALNRLAQASPAIKKSVLTACAHTVAADGVIQVDEAELLRAIGDTLDCPMPPFVAGV